MRRIGICFLLCLCAGGAFAYNESVAAISYNPSRLGAYQYLKAVQTATLGGGLEIDKDATMNVQAQGTVSLTDTDNDNKCIEGHCSVADSNGNINQITTIAPAGSEGDNVNTSVNSLAIMQKISTDHPILNYQYTDAGDSDKGTAVNMDGGALTATGDSFINQLSATANKLDIKATTSIQINNDAVADDTLKLGTITLIPNTKTTLIWKDYNGSKVLGYQ